MTTLNVPERMGQQAQQSRFYLIRLPHNKGLRWQPIRSAHLLSCFIKGMDRMRNGERMSARQEERNTGQERWAATWQLRVIWFVEAGGVGSQARRPGNVIQRACLNMTSLGAIQSAAKPSSGALAGMVAAEVRTVSSPPVNPSTSF